MKKLLALICAMALLLCCTAAMAEAVTTSNPLIEADNEYIAALAGKRIAAANVYLGDEWCKLLADAFTEYGEIYGFEVNNQDGNLDHDTQTRQIENFVTQQYDVLLVDPANEDGIGDVLEGAVEKKIPIVIYDSGRGDFEDMVAHVTADNYGNGVLAGEMCRDYINENLGGKARIVVLTLFQPHTMLREEGFRSVIDQMEGVEVITTQDSNGNRETAANIIAGIKEDYDIIFSVVPNGWLGAIAELEALNVPTDKVKVFGPISSEEAYDILRDEAAGIENYLVGGWSFDARILATATLEAAGKFFMGEEQEAVQKCQSLVLTKDNINEYYPAN